MAKKTYIGVNGVARSVKNIYIGVNGVARKVKAGWIGVNGVARQFYMGVHPIFGTGSDGDVVISTNTNLPSILNGDFVYKNYKNLTVNAGATLSVSNPCKGLFIRVQEVLTLNGIISMSKKGAYISSGGSTIDLGYGGYTIPAIGAAAGQNGVNGQCGGGGRGGNVSLWGAVRHVGGAGAAGYTFSGGCGGGGGCVGANPQEQHAVGQAGSAYGNKGGDGTIMVKDSSRASAGGGAGGNTAGQAFEALVTWVKGTPGQKPAGGLLIIIANEIRGTGGLTSVGSAGGNGQSYQGEAGIAVATGGGGSGGGSITVMFQINTNANYYADTSGGAGGIKGSNQENYITENGQPGGSGSYRLIPMYL